MTATKDPQTDFGALESEVLENLSGEAGHVEADIEADDPQNTSRETPAQPPSHASALRRFICALHAGFDNSS